MEKLNITDTLDKRAILENRMLKLLRKYPYNIIQNHINQIGKQIKDLDNKYHIWDAKTFQEQKSSMNIEKST